MNSKNGLMTFLRASILLLLSSAVFASEVQNFFCSDPAKIEDESLRKVLTPLERTMTRTQRSSADHDFKVGDAVYWNLTPEYNSYGVKGYRGGRSGIIRDISCDPLKSKECTVSFEDPYLGGEGGSIRYHSSSMDGNWRIETPRRIGGQRFTVKMSELSKASNTVLVPEQHGRAIKMTPVLFKPLMEALVVGDMIGGDFTRLVGSYAGENRVVEVKNEVNATPRAVKSNERILLPQESVTTRVTTRIFDGLLELRRGAPFVEDSKVARVFFDPVTQKTHVVAFRAGTASQLRYSIDRAGVVRSFDRESRVVN